LIGPQPAWSPPPTEAATQPIWVIAAIAAAVALAAMLGLGLIYGNWSLNRSIRRSREELPDRIDLPADDQEGGR
jgi:alkanesulfonate monooxygenase SsuD/methylene tetrahydromethanopterin reductase-like flavin-dependent oxidoreductase (luciferase family)